VSLRDQLLPLDASRVGPVDHVGEQRPLLRIDGDVSSREVDLAMGAPAMP
jgi:hypothetical protein